VELTLAMGVRHDQDPKSGCHDCFYLPLSISTTPYLLVDIQIYVWAPREVYPVREGLTKLGMTLGINNPDGILSQSILSPPEYATLRTSACVACFHFFGHLDYYDVGDLN